jgi:thioredoxin 1
MKTVMYFTADWCNPCKKVRPIVEEINRDMIEKIQIIDADLEITLVNHFQIKSIPTFIIVEDGHELNRITGAQTKESLEKFINHE